MLRKQLHWNLTRLKETVDSEQHILDLEKHDEAMKAYNKGLEYEPNNESLKSGLSDAQLPGQNLVVILVLLPHLVIFFLDQMYGLNFLKI